MLPPAAKKVAENEGGRFPLITLILYGNIFRSLGALAPKVTGYALNWTRKLQNEPKTTSPSSAQRLLGQLTKLCEVLSAIMFAALFLTFVAQVFWRYVLREPLVWTLEAAGILFVALSLFSAATQMGFRDHVALDLIVDAVPSKIARIMRALTLTFFAVIMALSLPDTVRVLEWMYEELTFALKFNLGHLFVLMIFFVSSYILRAAIDVFKLRDSMPKESDSE
jgi:TRAP-type C4-dicarboxylate transport system permease small subunit